MAAAVFQTARPGTREKLCKHSLLPFVNRYRRRLPHCDVIGQPVFVTFRLHGSLPAHRVFPPARLRTGKAFVTMGRILDAASSGRLFLARPEIARLVWDALQDGQLRFQRYQLHAFILTPNHVHVLVTPRVTARCWRGPSSTKNIR